MIISGINHNPELEIYGKGGEILGGIMWVDIKHMICEKVLLPGEKELGYTTNCKYGSKTKIIQIYEVKGKDFYWRRPYDYRY